MERSESTERLVATVYQELRAVLATVAQSCGFGSN
jgi:hypothetical protein